jgi:hypothetical protein
MWAHTSEFEEREFEAPLYNQLECGTRLVWSPGQVFEQYIGIDRALFLYDPMLWRFFGVSRTPRGVLLDRFDWPFWRARPRRRLPDFRLNLFIQAKRNYYHNRVPRKLKARLSANSCWRFDIDQAQQEAVGKVAERLGKRAVVCYAAPTFHRVADLNAHTVRGTIIAHSTFPLVHRLAGHGSFYYCSPGGSGVANPDPEGIEGVGLEDLLGNAAAGATDAAAAPANETVTTQLSALATDIETVIGEQVPEANPRKPLFFARLREALSLADTYEDIGPSGRAFLRVSAFASSFNLDWYAVTQG